MYYTDYQCQSPILIVYFKQVNRQITEIKNTVMNTTKSQILIRISNISKHFVSGRSTVDALKNVSLDIVKGELLAIVGPSGSGKTTLAHIIGGIAQPSEGEVFYKGNNLSHANDRELSNFRNRTVGFIFQNYSLLPHFTALENITLPLIVRGTNRKERKRLAKELLDEFGLARQTSQRSGQLSGGQKQRVAIARALVSRPEIIIADEPTGNLDSKNSEEVMATLEYLARRKNLAIVMVTHNPELAARADRIVRIRDGILKEVK